MVDKQIEMIRLWEATAREKTQRPVSRRGYSNKLGHYESHNLLLQRKKIRKLPGHHRVPGNSCIPPKLEAWSIGTQCDDEDSRDSEHSRQ